MESRLSEIRYHWVKETALSYNHKLSCLISNTLNMVFWAKTSCVYPSYDIMLSGCSDYLTVILIGLHPHK